MNKHHSDQQKNTNHISRRTLLRWTLGGAAGLAGLAGMLPLLAPVDEVHAQIYTPKTPFATLKPSGTDQAEINQGKIDQLQQDILNTLGSMELGFALRELDAEGHVIASIDYQSSKLYPVASCFKAFVVYYYFWFTPEDQWQADRDSNVYSVAVFSNNVRTGTVIRDTGQYLDVYGNPLEKFNDTLLFRLGMKEGLHTWKWEGNPLIGFTDRRFAPSDTRNINLHGVAHIADNLTTAADLAQGYIFMEQASLGTLLPNPIDPFFDTERAKIASDAALDLLSISAENYKSPIERAGVDYIGKDGVLREGDLIGVGVVISDAGLIEINGRRFAIAFISVGQSEFYAVETVKTLVSYIQTYAGVEVSSSSTAAP
jgi:hypothetical protein